MRLASGSQQAGPSGNNESRSDEIDRELWEAHRKLLEARDEVRIAEEKYTLAFERWAKS